MPKWPGEGSQVEFDVLRHKCNRGAVGRPGGFETHAGNTTHHFAGAAHDEKTASLPAGPERDALAVNLPCNAAPYL
jgi:hypothetical protein